MKKIITAIFLAASCAAVSGQEIYHLSLDRSIDIAKEQSYRMQNLRYTLDIATQNFKVAVGAQRLGVSAEFAMPNYNQGIGSTTDNQGIKRNFTTESLRLGGNLTVNQPLPTNGRVFLDANYSTVNNYHSKIRDGDMGFGIGFAQPLDAIYGFNNSKAAITRARLDYEQATKQYKREELDLNYAVSQSYYRMLLLQKRMEIAELDLERQREASNIAQQKYSAGLIREVDALQMEVDLASAESSYDQSVLNIYEQTNLFKDLLGLNARDSIILVSDLSYEIVSIDPELAVQLALKNRLEVREQEITIEQNRLNLKQQKAAGLPTANLSAYYGQEGANAYPLGLPYSDALSDLYGDMLDKPTYRIGLTVKVPIIDWGQNRAKVKISEARLEQSLLRQDQTEREIESQVRSLVSSIGSNLRRLQILEKSVTVAEKSFEITLKRFSDGDIDSQSLALERNRLNNAYTSHLDAFTSYQLSLIDLTRQTFYDFKAGRPIEE